MLIVNCVRRVTGRKVMLVVKLLDHRVVMHHIYTLLALMHVA